MLLGTLVPPPALPPRISVRLLAPDDPEVILAWAVPGVAFGHPGTAISEAGVTERDKIVADHDASTITLLREKLESSVSAFQPRFAARTARSRAGSYQLPGGARWRSPGWACCSRSRRHTSVPPSRRHRG